MSSPREEDATETKSDMVSAERRIPPVGCSQIVCSDHYVMPDLSACKDTHLAALLFLSRAAKPYDATTVMAGIEHLVKPERFVLMGPYDCEHIWMVRFTDAEARDAVVGAPDLKCAGQPAFCIEPLPEHSLHRGRCVGKGLGWSCGACHPDYWLRILDVSFPPPEDARCLLSRSYCWECDVAGPRYEESVVGTEGDNAEDEEAREELERCQALEREEAALMAEMGLPASFTSAWRPGKRGAYGDQGDFDDLEEQEEYLPNLSPVEDQGSRETAASDWENFWLKNGDNLVWQSWVQRYGEYMSPEYTRNCAETSTDHSISAGDNTCDDANSSTDTITESELRKSDSEGVSQRGPETETNEGETGNSDVATTLCADAESESSKDSTQESAGELKPLEELRVDLASGDGAAETLKSDDELWKEVWDQHYVEVYNHYYKLFGPNSGDGVELHTESELTEPTLAGSEKMDVALATSEQADGADLKGVDHAAFCVLGDIDCGRKAAVTCDSAVDCGGDVCCEEDGGKVGENSDAGNRMCGDSTEEREDAGCGVDVVLVDDKSDAKLMRQMGLPVQFASACDLKKPKKKEQKKKKDDLEEDEEELPNLSPPEDQELRETAVSDWENFWHENGDSLVWQSWVQRYGEYMSPEYAKNCVETLPDHSLPASDNTCEAANSSTDTVTESKLRKGKSKVLSHRGPEMETNKGETSNSNVAAASCADGKNESSQNSTQESTGELKPLEELRVDHASQDGAAETLKSDDELWKEVWDQHYIEVYNHHYSLFGLNSGDGVEPHSETELTESTLAGREKMDLALATSDLKAVDDASFSVLGDIDCGRKAAVTCDSTVDCGGDVYCEEDGGRVVKSSEADNHACGDLSEEKEDAGCGADVVLVGDKSDAKLVRRMGLPVQFASAWDLKKPKKKEQGKKKDDLEEDEEDRPDLSPPEDQELRETVASDWENFWHKNGDILVWQSWVQRYGKYISPEYARNCAETTTDHSLPAGDNTCDAANSSTDTITESELRKSDSEVLSHRGPETETNEGETSNSDIAATSCPNASDEWSKNSAQESKAEFGVGEFKPLEELRVDHASKDGAAETLKSDDELWKEV
ncbi:uncharacterized protein LOC144158808 isoform X1 [Haemaphysalis longicornis]